MYQASQGGVRLLLGTKALPKDKSISKKIRVTEFNGNSKTTVIV